MNLSVVSRQALKTIVSEPIDEQLHVLGKIIRDFEKIPDEASHRLCQDLRAHLGRIRETAESKPDQIRDALGLLKRVRGFDPRRAKIEEEQAQQAEQSEEALDPSDPKVRLQAAIKQSRLESSKPVSDCYEPAFVNAAEPVARVTAKYGSQKPQWSDTGHVEVLQAALGDLALDEHSVRQLWLSLAYAFHDGSFPGNEHSLLLSHICAFSNKRNMGVGSTRPNCFKTFLEELNFRA